MKKQEQWSREDWINAVSLLFLFFPIGIAALGHKMYDTET